MADGRLIFDTVLNSDGVEKGVNRLSGGLKKAASASLKAFTAATAAAATSVVVLGTNAVKSYAEYEQLVGGVETLFKDSQGIVMDYANNAYKTAGLSANEYMDTVTSFSASLLQSLDGDTTAAAEKANVAITDMSDNANKMGTNMQDIQNAYQGFAKQNYTMLDNLKLGYGGTKEEMSRLLEEASKISGIKYDISSYADIIDAIHVVQEEMDITGTTAKEASTTIEGSVNMTKSAWSNLVTGIADDNQDFNVLVDNFVTSASTAATNILPRIEIAINGIGTLIETLLPIIVNRIPEIIDTVLPKLITSGMNMLQAIVTGLQQNLPQIVTGVMLIMSQFVTTFIQMLPQIIEMGLQLIVQLALGIAQALPTLVPTIVEVMLQIVNTLIDNIDMLVDAAIQIIIALAQGLIASLPILIEKAPILISKLCEAIINCAGTLGKGAAELILKLGAGLIQNIPVLVKNVPQIVNAVLDALKLGFEAVVEIGGNLVIGLWNGINDKVGWIVDKVKGFGGNVLGAIKKAFDINSPSRKFRWIGQMCVEGFEQPLEEYNPYDTLGNSIQANEKVMQMNFAGSRNITTDRFDYKKLGRATADAIGKSGLKITIDDRELGRIVKGYN